MVGHETLGSEPFAGVDALTAAPEPDAGNAGRSGVVSVFEKNKIFWLSRHEALILSGIYHHGLELRSCYVFRLHGLACFF